MDSQDGAGAHEVGMKQRLIRLIEAAGPLVVGLIIVVIKEIAESE